MARRIVTAALLVPVLLFAVAGTSFASWRCRSDGVARASCCCPKQKVGRPGRVGARPCPAWAAARSSRPLRQGARGPAPQAGGQPAHGGGGAGGPAGGGGPRALPPPPLSRAPLDPAREKPGGGRALLVCQADVPHLSGCDRPEPPRGRSAAAFPRSAPDGSRPATAPMALHRPPRAGRACAWPPPKPSQPVEEPSMPTLLAFTASDPHRRHCCCWRAPGPSPRRPTPARRPWPARPASRSSCPRAGAQPGPGRAERPGGQRAQPARLAGRLPETAAEIRAVGRAAARGRWPCARATRSCWG